MADPTQHAEYVSVRVTDVYEAVRAFYGGDIRGRRTSEAIDRLNIALMGVPRIDLILKDHAARIDGSECGPVGRQSPAGLHPEPDSTPDA